MVQSINSPISLLIKTFDEKYEKLKPESNIWKSTNDNNNNRIITLEVSYWYHAYNFNTESKFGLDKLQNGEQNRLEVDDKKKRDKVSSCKIN